MLYNGEVPIDTLFCFYTQPLKRVVRALYWPTLALPQTGTVYYVVHGASTAYHVDEI
jgi:hypothetical protein